MLSFNILVGCVALLSSAIARESDLVEVGYYAESLCPDCIEMSTGPMDEAVNKIGSIFTLDYVPSGNAHMLADGTIQCQHGEMECKMNVVEACVVHYYKLRSDFWPFIHCMALQGSAQDYDVAAECADKNGIHWATIKKCALGEQGHTLELMNFNKTAALQPPHTHTPWITINGKHDASAEEFDLIVDICKAYTGSDKPTACP